MSKTATLAPEVITTTPLALKSADGKTYTLYGGMVQIRKTDDSGKTKKVSQPFFFFSADPDVVNKKEYHAMDESELYDLTKGDYHIFENTIGSPTIIWGRDSEVSAC